MANSKKLLAGTTGAIVAAASLPARADWSLLNMPVGVSELSREIYGMHMLILWICVVIAIFTFGAMIYAMVKFRKSKGAVADMSMLHNTKLEIAWTIVPVFILVGMAIPSVDKLIKIEDTTGSELTIKVTGYQWFWEYEYLGTGVSFYSRLDEASNEARQLDSGLDPEAVDHYLRNVDNPMVVPTGTKIRLLLTANDVNHAWWVPDFGMKRDAIPGFINEMWISVDADKPGTYRGQCAELCGRDHGFMPIVVVAKPRAEFDAWLAGEQVKAQQASTGAATTVRVETTDGGESVRLAKAE
ncbi:MAG: cytochrome B5 [Gammaproteobacteria bacterium SG8_30]|jgi:cytochrome c oxidase subunit 2|nr:MAG: cytochrome B5 [Gammaproteobacteria bacterium SG8_30]